MKYRHLGNSGLVVSRICLGTMTFGNPDWGCDGKTATKITNLFIEAGGNFIDTADMYSSGVSEEMLGAALTEHDRQSLVIATKCWFRTGPGQNDRGLSRKHIIDACDASLKRMGLDYVDLYQVHGPDPATGFAEIMRALDDLVRAGKVRYIGCSNLYAWQVVQANAIARAANQSTFVSGQYMYSLIRRDVEREILPACDAEGLGMLCWSPLAGGMLTGKYRGQDRPDPDSRVGKRAATDVPRYWSADNLALIDEVMAVAAEMGKTAPHVALSWLLADDRITSVINGARTVEQLASNLEVADWDLPDAQWKRLTDLSTFDLGYPKDWMAGTFPDNLSSEELPSRYRQRLP